MTSKDGLERQATAVAQNLLEQLVESSEMVDFRAGTYLLAALAANLGEQVRLRCREQAKRSTSQWDRAAAEAETVVTASWRCMETISALSLSFREPDPPRAHEP